MKGAVTKLDIFCIVLDGFCCAIPWWEPGAGVSMLPGGSGGCRKGSKGVPPILSTTHDVLQYFSCITHSSMYSEASEYFFLLSFHPVSLQFVDTVH